MDTQTKQVLNTSLAEVWDLIKDYRCETAIGFYQKEHGFPMEVSEAHFVELLKYFAITSVTTKNVTPSDQLDQMWHSFIIQTRAYASFCKKLGIFIHHVTKRGPQEKEYDNCVEIYQANFGELHEAWTMPRQPVLVDECGELCAVKGWCSSGQD